MVITEYKTDEHNYLVIDHQSTLPQQDGLVLTLVRDTYPTVGTLTVDYHNDTLSYSVVGRVTCAGRVTLNGDRMTVQYTEGYGFDVSEVDYTAEHRDILFNLLFTSGNKKIYYSYLFNDRPNCAIYNKDYSIFSYTTDHSYGGFSEGIQLYCDGSLVYTMNSKFESIGLPIDRTQYNKDKSYMDILNRLVVLSKCVLYGEDNGNHIVAKEESSLAAIRSFYGAPTFATNGSIYSFTGITINGTLYSMKDDANGSYFFVKPVGFHIDARSDWLGAFINFDLDDITEIVSIINDDYNPARVLEYYADKKVTVNFKTNLPRIEGELPDTDYVISHYSDMAYYDRDKDCLVIDVEPAGELQVISNSINLVGSIDTLSSDSDYTERFGIHHRVGWPIFYKDYLPYAGTSTKPLKAKIVDITNNGGSSEIVFDLSLWPALFKCIYCSDSYSYKTVEKAFDYILTSLNADLPNNPFSFVGKSISVRTPTDLSFDKLNPRQLQHIDNVYNDMAESYLDYGFSRVDMRADFSTYTMAYVQFWRLISGTNVPIKAGGYNSWYWICPIYTRRIKCVLVNGPFQPVVPSQDFNTIVNLLPEEKREIFRGLFIKNTLCLGPGSSLIPFHLFFRINPQSVPQEIEDLCDSFSDVECACTPLKGNYTNSTSKGGVIYANPL